MSPEQIKMLKNDPNWKTWDEKADHAFDAMRYSMMPEAKVKRRRSLPFRIRFVLDRWKDRQWWTYIVFLGVQWWPADRFDRDHMGFEVTVLNFGILFEWKRWMRSPLMYENMWDRFKEGATRKWT
jgi:hypothetical protein